MPYPQVQQKAPSFKCTALMPNKDEKVISLDEYAGKWVVLFFYPLDWTFVCPTEIIAFGDRQPEFSAINTQVIAASCDSYFSHLAWCNAPRSDGGLGDMKIPILADFDKKVATDYGCLLPDGVPLRALYIISPTGVLRQITVNDLPVGRNVDEIIRLIKAFQFVDVHGEVCPANWQPGDATMNADPVKSKTYFNSTWGDSSASGGSSAADGIAEVTAVADFYKCIKGSGLTVVDYWAPWCKNCKKVSPTFSRFASQYKSVTFLKVNTTEAEALSSEYGVDSLPTFQFFKAGVKVAELKGVDATAIENEIKKYM